MRSARRAATCLRPALSRVHSTSLSEAPGPSAVANLDGSVAWVVGGAGVIGAGLVRGLLRAGATVICNSRHKPRLEALMQELGHPEKLVTLQGSMLPESAEATVAAAMQLTGGQLDHVVTHSAVRWWTKDSDETNTIGTIDQGVGGLLSLDPEEFAIKSSVLPQMQFATARLLIPRLQQLPHASYTFVTGGAGEHARSPLGQINAQSVWGLAAALRQETRVCGSQLKVSELRVGMKFNRRVEERRADPREQPLSHEIGHIAAGMAATGDADNTLHHLDSPDAILALKQRFPVVDKGYNVYFSPENLLF